MASPSKNAMLNVPKTRGGPPLATKPPPKPESHPRAYTRDRLEYGRAWAHEQLNSKTRKPSPLTHKYLVTYHDSCDEAINHVAALNSCRTTDSTGNEREEALNAYLSTVRAAEVDLNDRHWLRACESPQEQEEQDEILALRRLAYLARYGDYFAQETNRLRRAANELEFTTEESKNMAPLRNKETKWTEISRALKQEESTWKKHGTTRGLDRVRNYHNIHLVCGKLGIDLDESVQSIHLYAERNEQVHCGLLTLIVGRKWSKLAKTLSTDLNDLDSLVPAGSLREYTYTKTLLTSLIGRYFQTLDPNDTDTWVPTAECIQESKLLQEAENEKRAAAETNFLNRLNNRAKATRNEIEYLQIYEQAMESHIQFLNDGQSISEDNPIWNKVGKELSSLKLAERKNMILKDISKAEKAKDLDQATNLKRKLKEGDFGDAFSPSKRLIAAQKTKEDAFTWIRRQQQGLHKSNISEATRYAQEAEKARQKGRFKECEQAEAKRDKARAQSVMQQSRVNSWLRRSSERFPAE